VFRIQKTTDYSQFKFLEDKNRPPTPNYMIQAIQQKNLLAEHPIICDVNMNVIDGQNRLKAAEFLRLPVYYIVSENITPEDIGLCQIQKPWAMTDYLKFYKTNENYAFVDELIQLYGLAIHFVIYCCNQASNINKEFRTGNFIIKKDKPYLKQRMQYIKEIMILFSDLKKNSGERDITISSRMQRSLWSFVCQDKYDHKRMIHAINTYPDNALPILSFNSEKMIAHALKKRLYNFKRVENRLE